MAMSDSHRPHGVRVRLWQGSRARTSHRPYYAPLDHLAKLVHSRGDGLSSPCSGCCLIRQDSCSLQKSYAYPNPLEIFPSLECICYNVGAFVSIGTVLLKYLNIDTQLLRLSEAKGGRKTYGWHDR